MFFAIIALRRGCLENRTLVLIARACPMAAMWVVVFGLSGKYLLYQSGIGAICQHKTSCSLSFVHQFLRRLVLHTATTRATLIGEWSVSSQARTVCLPDTTAVAVAAAIGGVATTVATVIGIVAVVSMNAISVGIGAIHQKSFQENEILTEGSRNSANQVVPPNIQYLCK